jgi:hypothetical protein
MAAISNGQHWRDRAIAQSAGVSDLWDVFQAWAGHFTHWILFFCMIENIISMLPDMAIAAWVTNTVLGVQVIALDIGGLSLATLAKYAKEQGHKEEAKQAGRTSKFLIVMMMVTLVLVGAGVIYPIVKPYTDDAEKVLILVRILMTVWYGHILHALRSVGHNTLNVEPAQPPITVAPEPIDYQELARQLLPALRNDLQALLPLARENDAPIIEIEAQQFNEIEATTSATKQRVRVARSGAPTARQTALKILARTPDIDATTLARKADCTASYARKIIAEQKGNQ